MRKIAYLLLWLFVFSVPWQAVVMISGIGTISRLLGLVSFGLGLTAVLTEARFRPPTMFHVVAVSFFAWGSLTVFWSIDPTITRDWILDNIQVLAAAWLIWELGTTPERHEGLMRAYGCGAMVAALDTIWNYRTGVLAQKSSESTQRFAATGFNPNDLGFLLAISLPIAWYFSLRASRPWVMWINRLYLPVGLLAVLLTGSRGSLIVAIIGCVLILPWTLPRVPQRTRIIVVTLLVLSVFTALSRAPEASLERIATTKQELVSGTLNSRRIVWAAALDVVPRTPMLGVGGGNFVQAVLPALGYEKRAHNAYLEVLVETGMIGLALFLLLFVTSLAHAWKAPRHVRPLLVTIFLCLLVGLIPRAAATEKTTWVLFAFLLYPLIPSTRRVVPQPLPSTGEARRQVAGTGSAAPV